MEGFLLAAWTPLKLRLTVLRNNVDYASRRFVPPPIRHDANGNRATKTTSFGKIRYWYDKENRLVHSGSDAGRGTDYIYDKNGNLIEKKNLYKTDIYSYTGSNRMKSSVIEDHREKTKTITRYDYDALGRRTLVQDEGSTLMRTLYDGMSFDIIREQESFADGYFTNTSDTYVDWQTSGGESASRYRYIGEEAGSSGGNSGQAGSQGQNSGNFRANSNADYRLVSPNRSRSSVTLFAKGEAVATNKNSYSTSTTSTSTGNRSGTTSASTKRSYFGTDMMGSVRSTTHDDGLNANYYDYDVFGKPFGETSDYGYVGKPYDPTTGMYNYGYRDYSPQTARFTTVDPIRDGSNWFVYCNNEPVNFVDLWGYFSFSITINATAAAGAEVTAGVGLAVGFSLKKGFSFGLIKTQSIGAQQGGSANVSIALGFDPKATEIVSGTTNSVTIGGSGALPVGIGVGGDLAIDMETKDISYSANISLGVGTLGEAHQLYTVTNTITTDEIVDFIRQNMTPQGIIAEAGRQNINRGGKND